MKKKYLVLSLLIIIFLSSTSFALALEVSLPGLSNNPTLPEYVRYFFNFGISIVAILSLISFTVGAVGLIAPNIEAHNNAKDRMKGAVLGLVLTLASFIIMQTINPALTNISLNRLPTIAGVFYTDGNNKKPCPQENTDTSEIINSGFDKILYECTAPNSPALLIWEFPEPGLEKGNPDLSTVKVVRKICGETESISFKSFKWELEYPGVYYCLGGCDGNMCSNYMSGVVTESQENIKAPFAKSIGAIRIISDPPNNLFYGAIIHESSSLRNGGGCSPVLSPTNDLCIDTTAYKNSSAADIFKFNKDSSSGNGVSFYSEAHGWDTGQNAGHYDLTDSVITTGPTSVLGLYDIEEPNMAMIFDYTNVNVTSEYKDTCITFGNCAGSIRIKGSYLVGLYSTDTNGSLYCQTFIKDVPNLDATSYIAPGVTFLDSVYIVPLK